MALIKKILVVDDTEVIRDLLAEVLRNDGYQVDKAADGIEAVAMAKKHSYDLVFTDMHMPRQNGMITARNIIKIAPFTAVVITDSYPDKLAEAAVQEGVVGTICKPFDLAELRNLISKIEMLASAKQGAARGD